MKKVLMVDSATKLIITEPNPPGDLAELTELQGSGFTIHTADHNWAVRSLQGATGISIANPEGLSGDPVISLSGDAAAAANLSGAGLVAKDQSGAWVGREIVGTPNQVIVQTGSGLTGNPTLSLPQNIDTGATPEFAGMKLSSLSGLLKATPSGLTAATLGSDYVSPTGAGATGSWGINITGAAPFGADQQLTTSTLSQMYTARLASTVSKFSWTNTQVAALGAVLSGQLSVCQLPAKTVIHHAFVVLGSAAGGATTLTVSLGHNTSDYNNLLVAQDAKATAGTIYGNDAAERGVGLTMFSLPSMSASTEVFVKFTSQETNLSDVTTCSGDIYLITSVLP